MLSTEPGREDEPRVARAEVVARVALAQPDVRQQAGQQRGVHPGGVGRLVGLDDAEIARDAAQLADEVLPLADAQVVQELVAAHPAELRCPTAFVSLLAQVAPEVEVGR